MSDEITLQQKSPNIKRDETLKHSGVKRFLAGMKLWELY